jgi:hypothetical protein
MLQMSDYYGQNSPVLISKRLPRLNSISEDDKNKQGIR